MGCDNGRAGGYHRYCICLILLLWLTGCEGSGPPKETWIGSIDSDALTNEASSDENQVKRPSIGFLPEVPIAASEVLANLSHVPEPYELVWERNGQVLEDVLGDVLPKGRVTRGDTLVLRVRFEDDEIQTSAQVGNSPPEIVAINFSDPAIHHGVDIVLDVSAIDADGDPVRFNYHWSLNGEEVPNQDHARLPGHLYRKGDRVAVQITPADRWGEGATFSGREFVIPGAPPRFVSNPPAQVINATFLYQAQAVDPDGDSIRYVLEEGPKGMSINTENGLVEWKSDGTPAGNYSVRLRAVDSDGMAAILEFLLTITGSKPTEPSQSVDGVESGNN